MKVSKLKLNPNNPRIIKDDKFHKLVESLKNFPEMMEKRPMVCVTDEDGKIYPLGGNMRLKAVQELKMKEIPDTWVLMADEWTEEQRKEFTIKDNVSFGEWNFDELANSWDADKLVEWGMDVPDFGTNEVLEAEEDDFEIPDEIQTDIVLGDLFEIGNHRLLCGDSTDSEQVAKLMNGAKADMVLSDPPYGMFLDTDFSSCLGSLGSLGRKNHTSGNKYDKVIGDNEDFKPELITTFFDNFNYCKEIFLFGADYFAEILPNKNNGSWLVWDKRKESQADAIGAEFELIWSKQKHKRRMLRHDWFGFLSSQNAKDAQHRVHPTQKPITLLADIIKQWGQDCNIIIDLYGGSGSTLIACEQLNRICYMMELDPKYCQVIIDRMCKLDPTLVIKKNGVLI
jgi:DNA modification methylase